MQFFNQNLKKIILKQIFKLAPPPSQFQDFEYHWKLVKNFYSVEKSLPKVHLNDTNIPGHLEAMLQILITEQENDDGKKYCLTFLLNNRLLGNLYFNLFN